MNTVVLIGLPASGKSTVGRALAEILNYVHIDLDIDVERKYAARQNEHKNCRQIVQQHGELYFRGLEYSCLKDLQTGQTILSVGGGTATHGPSRPVLREKGPLVYLHACRELLRERLEASWPASFSKNNWSELYQKRHALYADIADFQVKTDGLGIAEIVDEIRGILAHGK